MVPLPSATPRLVNHITGEIYRKSVSPKIARLELASDPRAVAVPRNRLLVRRCFGENSFQSAD